MRDRYEASFRQAQPLLFFTFKPLALYRGLIIKAPTTLCFFSTLSYSAGKSTRRRVRKR